MTLTAPHNYKAFQIKYIFRAVEIGRHPQISRTNSRVHQCGGNILLGPRPRVPRSSSATVSVGLRAAVSARVGPRGLHGNRLSVKLRWRM